MHCMTYISGSLVSISTFALIQGVVHSVNHKILCTNRNNVLYSTLLVSTIYKKTFVLVSDVIPGEVK